MNRTQYKPGYARGYHGEATLCSGGPGPGHSNCVRQGPGGTAGLNTAPALMASGAADVDIALRVSEVEHHVWKTCAVGYLHAAQKILEEEEGVATEVLSLPRKFIHGIVEAKRAKTARRPVLETQRSKPGVQQSTAISATALAAWTAPGHTVLFSSIGAQNLTLRFVLLFFSSSGVSIFLLLSF